jgi:hypothetical protein
VTLIYSFDRALIWSQNYLNGLVSVTSYAYANLDPSDAVFNTDPNPLAQIINLRGQAEKASKTQQMYEQRPGGWIEWEDVQVSTQSLAPVGLSVCVMY